MLDKAIQRSAELGLTDTNFIKMDAQNLDFPVSMFDIVTCNMSFQFFPDQEKALLEMHRVLKPGGVVAILCPGMGSGREVVDAVRSVARRHPEYPMLMDAVAEFGEGFPALGEFIDLFDSVGLRETVIHGRHSMAFVDPANMLHDTNAYWGVWRSGLPSGAVELIRGELMNQLMGLSEDRGFRRTSYLLIGVGIKPS
jgi:SAM-dependent methyltransferase